MINHQTTLYEQQLRIMTCNLQNTELDPTTPEFQPAECPFSREDTPLDGEAPVWLPVNFEVSRKGSCKSDWEELSPLEEESEESEWGSGGETTTLTTPEARKTPVIGEAASESDVKLDWLGTDEDGKMDIEEWLKERKGRSLPLVGSEKWVEVKREARDAERMVDGYC
jgi:hypothetical protein